MTEKMKIEMLMMVRYKVIADYPNSPFTIGRIYKYGERLPGPGLSSFEPYPHLFRKLEWWEDRKPGELIGLFAKRKDGKHVTRINEPISTDGAFFLWDNLKNSVPFSDYLPATKSEYLAYINSPTPAQ